MEINQFNRLRDQLFYQKFGIMLQKITDWKNQKDAKYNNYYHQRVSSIIKQADNTFIEISNQIQALIQLIEVQKDFLIHLKGQKGKPIKGGKDKMIHININPAFQVFHNQFCKNRDNLIQFKQFLITFDSILRHELISLKKIYDNFDIFNLEIKIRAKEGDKQDKQALSNLSIKKNKKTFNIKIIFQLENIFYKQISTLSSILYRTKLNQKQLIQKRKDTLQNIIKNLQYYSKLQKNIFGIDINLNIIQIYQQKLKKSQQKIKDTQSQKLQQQFDRKKQQQLANIIRYQIRSIFQKIIQEITIRSWIIDAQEDKQKFIKKIAHLTLDNKFLLMDQYSILKEIDLNTAIVETKKNNIQIKAKKKSQNGLVLKFDSDQRQDQFLLHVQKMHSQNL